MKGIIAKPQEYRVNGQVMLSEGMGCRKLDNCFECPEKKCTWQYSSDRRMSHVWWYTDGLHYGREPI